MVGKKRNDLRKAIDTLLQEHRVPTVEQAAKFFEFTSLLRWPRDPKSAQIATRILLARFVADTFTQANAESRVAYLPILLAHANPSDIIPLLLSDDGGTVALDIGDVPGQDLVASIVRFLLSPSADETERRKAPSIKKAFYLLKAGKLYGQDPLSWKSFSQAWATFKDVGPFLFVRRYSFRGSLNAQPSAQNFLPTVNAIIGDKVELRGFFGKAKWATSRLQTVLDPMALKEMRLPQFPSDLEAMPVSLASASPAMLRLLEDYAA